MSLIKKIGLRPDCKNVSLFLINQKLTHFIIVFLTILFVSLNLTGRTQAGSLEETAGNTFLSKIVSSEFDDNDQLIEEYFDETAQITPEQQTYLENLTALKSQPTAEMILPDESEITANKENLIQGNDVIFQPDLVTTKKVKRLRDETIYYTVETGDTVSTIAAKFDISVNTILWENNLSAYSLIRPGDKLTILPMSGVIYKIKRGDTIGSIAKDYNIEESAITEANKLANSGRLSISQQLIIPGGKKNSYAQPKNNSYSGLAVIMDLLKPKATKPLSGNKMNWPTVGYRITQYYSWSHHAVDIANKVGTSIYAADAGVIEVIGWGRGYGNQIVINHGGGRKTRYAHQSKFYVKKGQYVNKGEVIGAMGSTGRSTGPHLHFEVIINNIKYNPLKYIK
ncbi:MAG: M23 family metallopeptidase [Patescibacteria group bacterium]